MNQVALAIVVLLLATVLAKSSPKNVISNEVIQCSSYRLKGVAERIEERDVTANSEASDVEAMTRPVGDVKCVESNGDVYEGQMRLDDGRKFGHGTLKAATTSRSYDGHWLDDLPHGKGLTFFENGDVFEGNYNRGKREGEGSMKYNDGGYYTGSWANDNIHGRGSYRYLNGDSYDGDWRDGKPHGKGTHKYASKSVYEGSWVNGQCQGRGKMAFYNGNTYNGQWKNSKMHGKGVYEYSADNGGSKYDGDFDEDSWHGTGKITWRNGDIYVGEWRANRRTGKGYFTTSDGGVYEGEFLNDEFHGAGRLTLVDGRVVEGYFEHGAFKHKIIGNQK
jgi:hypothetical protein